MTDIRKLQDALNAGADPSVLWKDIEELSKMAFTKVNPDEWFIGKCRMCDTEYWTRLRPKGTKWTSTCPSCIADEL